MLSLFALSVSFATANGAKVDGADFPCITLHEKALLDLISGASFRWEL